MKPSCILSAPQSSLKDYRTLDLLSIYLSLCLIDDGQADILTKGDQYLILSLQGLLHQSFVVLLFTIHAAYRGGFFIDCVLRDELPEPVLLQVCAALTGNWKLMHISSVWVETSL